MRNEISTPSFGSINGPISGQLPLLNVDVDFLIVRQENCLDTIREVRKALIDSERQAFESANGVSLLQQFDELAFLKTNQDIIRKEIRKALIGKIVVTRYNNTLYWVKDIDFNMSPESQFVLTIT